MNHLTQDTHNVPAHSSSSRMVIAAICLALLVPSGVVVAQSELPSLRRMQIHDGRAYMFDFDVPDALGRIALLELSWEKDPSRSDSKYYYIFGTNLGLVSGVRDNHNRAWTLTNNTLYFVVQHGRGHMRSAGFFRYPYDALIPGPGRFWDRAKLGIEEQDIFDFDALHRSYAPRISPLTNPLRGFEMNDEGTVRAVWVNPKVTFDLTANDGVPQLYVSVDGRLSRHEFRKEEWKRLQTYNVQVHGEFVVVSNGKALVTKVDDHWCVVSDLEAKGTTTRIARALQDREMLVVYDVNANSTYLVFDAQIFDTSGAVRDELPISRNVQDHARSVLESVLGYREKR